MSAWSSRSVNSSQRRLERTIPPTCHPDAGQDVVQCLAGVLDSPAWQGFAGLLLPGRTPKRGGRWRGVRRVPGVVPERVLAAAHAVVARWWEHALCWEGEERPYSLHLLAEASVSRGVDVTWAASVGTWDLGAADEEGPVMRVSSQDVTVVALLADPDTPTEIAQRMARTLAARLADKSGQGRRFDVEVVSEPFTSGTEDPPTLMRRIMDRGSAENWDIVVALTDLPLHSHGRRLAVNLNHEHGLALLSSFAGACGCRRGPGGPSKKPCLAWRARKPLGLKDLREGSRFWGPSSNVSRLFVRARSVRRRPTIFGTSSAGRAVTCGCSSVWSAPTGRGGW